MTQSPAVHLSEHDTDSGVQYGRVFIWKWEEKISSIYEWVS